MRSIRSFMAELALLAAGTRPPPVLDEGIGGGK